jgi:hypothetical protein
MSGVSPEFWRATGPGYGVQSSNYQDRALRKHLLWCDGIYCEQAKCEKGKAWRKTQPGAKWRAIDNEPQVQPGAVREGGSQDQSSGTQERTPAGVRVRLPVLPGQDRPGERTTVDQADRGASQSDRTADGAKEQTPSPTTRTVEVRDGRPSNQSERPTPVQQRQATPIPESLPTLQAKNPTRGSEGAQEAMAIEAPRVKRTGRPRKHANVSDRMKAYRERKRRGR